MHKKMNDNARSRCNVATTAAAAAPPIVLIKHRQITTTAIKLFGLSFWICCMVVIRGFWKESKYLSKLNKKTGAVILHTATANNNFVVLEDNDSSTKVVMDMMITTTENIKKEEEEAAIAKKDVDQKDNDPKEEVHLPVPIFNSSCIPTVLASYPGSGSTITRLLIEMATGVWTGSVYNDGTLKKSSPHAFQGEHYQENVVAIKTHGPFRKQNNIHKKLPKIQRAILIIRNPFTAIPSCFNYFATHRHDVQASEKQWESFIQTSLLELSNHNTTTETTNNVTTSTKSKTSNVYQEMKDWSNHFSYWMDRFTHSTSTTTTTTTTQQQANVSTTTHPGDDHSFYVGIFEDLVSKEKGSTILKEISEFLKFPSSQKRMDSIWSLSMNLSSSVHRRKSYIPKYPPQLSSMVYEILLELRIKYRGNPKIAAALENYMNSSSKYTTTTTKVVPSSSSWNNSTNNSTSIVNVNAINQ